MGHWHNKGILEALKEALDRGEWDIGDRDDRGILRKILHALKDAIDRGEWDIVFIIVFGVLLVLIAKCILCARCIQVQSLEKKEINNSKNKALFGYNNAVVRCNHIKCGGNPCNHIV